MSESDFVTGVHGTSPRCRSMAPLHPSLRCLKADIHNRADAVVTHKNGHIVWLNTEADRATQIQTDFATLIDPSLVFNTGFFSDPPHGATELADWWRNTAESEIEQTVAKAVEYGSTDLIDIGRSIARIAGRNDGDFTDTDAALWGIFFYLEGKLSRWRSALERGDRVSDDTLLDIGVYARMAQRVVETGGWPGTQKSAETRLASSTQTSTTADPVFHMYCDPNAPCSPDCQADLRARRSAE